MENSCIDPLMDTNYHLLSSVKHSKIQVIKNIYPNFQILKSILIKSILKILK